LTAFVDEAVDPSISLDTLKRRASSQDGAYEIRHLTPKAAAVLEATADSSDPDDAAIAKQVANHLLNSRSDHLWRMVLPDTSKQTTPDHGTPSDSLVPTALVLRGLSTLPEHQAHVEKCVEIALQRLDQLSGQAVVGWLFVLNSLMRASKDKVRCSEIRRKTMRTVRELYRAIGEHPLVHPNPINFDFFDSANSRCRDFRLPSDVILLESLILVSDQRFEYVDAAAGRAIIDAWRKVLEAPSETRDPSNHRPAITSIAYFLSMAVFFPDLVTPRNISNQLSNVWPLLAVAIGRSGSRARPAPSPSRSARVYRSAARACHCRAARNT
jgi:hypothetical protein